MAAWSCTDKDEDGEDVVVFVADEDVDDNTPGVVLWGGAIFSCFPCFCYLAAAAAASQLRWRRNSCWGGVYDVDGQRVCRLLGRNSEFTMSTDSAYVDEE